MDMNVVKLHFAIKHFKYARQFIFEITVWNVQARMKEIKKAIKDGNALFHSTVMIRNIRYK
jgi:hypothetical protein